MTENAAVAFLYPGVGIAYAPALEALEASAAARPKIEEARAYHRARFPDPDDPTTREHHEQAMVYAISCAITDAYKSEGTRPAAVMGYSFGIYATLYGAEVCGFETGLDILTLVLEQVRDCYASAGRRFGMGGVIGLTEQELMEEAAAGLTGTLDIAFYNGERSFVLVGDRDNIEEVLRRAEAMGAFKCVLLPTSLGYHARLLKALGPSLEARLNAYSFDPPACPIFSSLTASSLASGEVAAELVRNLWMPVQWEQSMKALDAQFSPDRALEVGPGESLSKITRYILRRLKVSPYARSEV